MFEQRGDARSFMTYVEVGDGRAIGALHLLSAYGRSVSERPEHWEMSVCSRLSVCSIYVFEIVRINLVHVTVGAPDVKCRSR